MNIIQAKTLDDLKLGLSPFFTNKPEPLPPFSSKALAFCQSLSQMLFEKANSKKNPDLIALAFWLRKNHLHQMHQDFLQKSHPLQFSFPCGVAFHIPPANIETMLAYSWISSLLTGNCNIIRVSRNDQSRPQKLLQIIQELLSQSEHSKIAKMTWLVHYGHEEEFTAWISSKVDLRIIWGGDNTIKSIKKHPLQAHAKDIAFPDRFSFAAINAEIFLKSDANKKKQHCIDFFNDVYWFDQSACSSPRLIFWIGDDITIEKASQEFYETLQEIIKERLYELPLGAFLMKQTHIYEKALTLPIEAITLFSNELSVLQMKQLNDGCRHHIGQGLLYHVPIKKLEEIRPFVAKIDQTMTYLGFSQTELQTFAASLNGKGITQIVPFGQALNFNLIWDGRYLPAEFSEVLRIQ